MNSLAENGLLLSFSSPMWWQNTLCTCTLLLYSLEFISLVCWLTVIVPRRFGTVAKSWMPCRSNEIVAHHLRPTYKALLERYLCWYNYDVEGVFRITSSVVWVDKSIICVVCCLGGWPGRMTRTSTNKR